MKVKKMDTLKIENAVRDILEAIGEDPNREGLLDTPKRIAKMYEEIFSGLHENPKDHLQIFFQEENHEEMVIVKDISFHSVCEHHLVPFFGKAHVAYIPKGGKLTGLSKLARVVETAARRPQLQERIAKTVAESIMEVLKPHGVLVVLEGEHMCMTMRGIKKPGSKTITSSVRGIFETDAATRAEALSLINSR
ncbi:GTP cyclohydrolase I [Acetoanaerobium pronyense]|uniref:GTP cyclohydrolase 1 n=1 Tax=Acetoanaerobium pronyense TaxID=1482736 RepID=A0ABS4KIC7_9FIRM|nr:GTP cyclohydrolase I FolE [Acetoanaerobium pronyense]MBP2026374.1 GTP cyclohydrolase I [Acetoanaerobium pronyense]